MKRFFYPNSVAVIGASRDPQKIGYIILDNLISAFSGKVFPVNPNADVILGEKTTKTVLDIKEKIDLAIICVPQKIAAHALESCGKKKIPYVIMITAGYSEAGRERDEEELLKIARKFGIRILGPNCLGLINNFAGLNASFATAKLPAKHRVAVFSQSGAMGSALLDYANKENFGFSYFVSLGNKVDISETDLLEAWVEDENVKVAVGYLEDIKDGEAFLPAARKFTEKKPLIILKGGTTKVGSRAAGLHTAALAQDSNVFEAAMEDAGVILAKNLGDMFELALSFAVNGAAKGPNLVIISNAGGPSVLAADAISGEGVSLAKLSAYTINSLMRKTEGASFVNPIDLRGDASREDFRVAFDLCQKDPGVDGILAIISPQAMTEVDSIAWEAVRARGKNGKPIYANFLGGELIEKAREVCSENCVPVFSYPERAVRAFAFQAKAKKRKKQKESGKKHPKHAVAKSILHFHRGRITGERLHSLFGLYGIPMAKTYLVKGPEEAEKAFSELRPPVVMKISSPDILHKTDIGGVILGVTSKEEARESYLKIIKNVNKHVPQAQIDGVTMMETAKEGVELIAGVKRDNVFGPVLVFGFGGIFVELISDFSVVVSPFTKEKIAAMVSKTKVSKLIEGYRGIKYDKESLYKILLGLAQLIADHKEIESAEINPIILEEGGTAFGLDAKIEAKFQR